MADSLIISNAIELLGNEAVSTNPRCAGAQFMLQPGFNLGAPQPTTDYIASLILDGERPFGQRSSNRTITLPIWIKAPNRYILAAAREVLEEAIDQQTWTLAWTRDPGVGGTPLTLLLDCFRAQPSVPVYNTQAEKQSGVLGSQITITFEALPYGRSDTQTQVAFAAPVPTAPPPPPAPVVLDAFSSISGAQFFQSSRCIIGPFSLCWDPDLFGDPGGKSTPLTYSSMFTSPLDLTGMTSVQGYLGLGSRYWWALERPGRTRVRVDMTLTDTNGQTLSFSRANLNPPVAPVFSAPVFTRVTLFIPQGDTAFSYDSVASYSLTITNRAYPVIRFGWVTAYLDALTAYPSSQTAAPVTRGNVYTLYGVQGTARAPASLQFQQAAAPGTPTTLTTAGAGTYTVPSGTLYLKVEAVGGGGAGASETTTGTGGGGGGAEYAAEYVFACSPADVIPYSIGAGGTSGSSPADGQATIFGPDPGGTQQVTANGGHSAAQNSSLGAAGGSGSGNSVHFSGGTGRTATGSVGGGGGGSGGSASPGQTPAGTGATTITTPGTSSWMAPAGVTSVVIECWGAGGGGSSGSWGGTFANIGSGAGGGEYSSATVAVTPGNSYAYTVGGGGSGGGTGGHLAGAAGGTTSFTGATTTVTAHGGSGGQNNYNPGSGGSGSGNTTHHNGGQGGSGYPYTGGGGSSGASAATGNTGGKPGGAVAPSGGGSGGSGSGPGNGAGTAGSAPGGGGGGSYNTGYAGGAGAAGQIRINYPAGLGAPTNVGATAVTGGGAGGNGGGSSNTAGSTGGTPGGGGGGADSAGTSEAGGAGGAGRLVLTPYTNPAFKTLIVHRPPLGAPKTFQPLVSVGGGSDVPNGGTQYTMPQPVSGVSADFSGTYTLYLINDTWNGSSSRTITVTVTQWDVSGGTSNAVSTTPVTITPAQVTNGIVTAGVLTLPQKAVAADNTGGFYTVSVTDTNTSDRFYDLIFLDTMGQTAVINEPSTGYSTFWIDEPGTLADLGLHLGSNSGRPNAISVMDACPSLSGGPITLEPADGDNLVFAYCIEGAPAIGLTYYARWFYDRLF